MATYRTGCKIPPVDDSECREWSGRFIDLVLRGAPLPHFIFSTVTELDDDGKVMSKVNRDVKLDLAEVCFGQVQEEDMEMKRPSKSRNARDSTSHSTTHQPLVRLCCVYTSLLRGFDDAEHNDFPSTSGEGGADEETLAADIAELVEALP
eukprot:3095122-Amphidinium_carterae.4